MNLTENVFLECVKKIRNSVNYGIVGAERTATIYIKLRCHISQEAWIEICFF